MKKKLEISEKKLLDTAMSGGTEKSNCPDCVCVVAEGVEERQGKKGSEQGQTLETSCNV